MGRRYSTSNSVANTANLPIISLTGSTAVRPKVYDLCVGSSAAPVDQNAAYTLVNISAAGDRDALVAAANDSGDPVALSTPRGQTGGTVNPTFGTSIFLRWGMNQRAPFRWVAAPGGEFTMPVGTANGIAFRSPVSSAAFTCDASLAWEE